MTLWSKISSYFAASPAPAQASAPAAPAKPLREAKGKTIDADDEAWIPLGKNSKRDLTPLTQQRMQEVAVYLWEGNLLAKALVELPVAYLLAEGVSVTVADEDAQEWLTAFWDDPINRLDLRLEQMARELSLFGEQCWPVFTNEMDGMVRLGNLDPSLIATVVHDPDNSAQPIGIVTRKDKRGNARRYRVIINGPESVFTSRTQEIRQGFSDGECFYFCVNQLSGGRRGRSDLLAPADWADAYENFLFRAVDRSDLLNSFIWDVTLTGATPEQVAARAREIVPPKPNSTRVHNDAETWKAEAPDLKAADHSTFGRLIRNHVLGGAFIPEHWYGGGGDVNRATAGEMSEPTLKVFTLRQRLLKAIVASICTYQIRKRLEILERLSVDGIEQRLKEPEWKVAVEMPEMTARDTTAYASALAQVVVACASAIDRGLMSEDTAVQIIAAIAGRLGVQIDAAEELRKAKEEREGRDEADSFRDPPAADDAAEGNATDDAAA